MSTFKAPISWEEYNKLINDILNPYTNPLPKIYNQSPNISPTEVAAAGLFEYEEPEQDEQGTFYGYKILYANEMLGVFMSPRLFSLWENGELVADKIPSEDSMHGIHCTKAPNHPELVNYHHPAYEWFLVKCALYGEVVIETEQGFRAHCAAIIGVYNNGNWQTYQDYQERAEANSRKDAEAREEGWKYIGRWNTGTGPNPYYNPNP